ncbi:MAG: hypothetical protein ACREIT_07330, partial [Tepidisphaeraceae bacterium]
MTQLVNQELWSVFDARRVKAPELRGLDSAVNGVVGWVKNRRPILARLKAQAERIEKLEPEIHGLSSSRFREEVDKLRDTGRLGQIEEDDDLLDRAMAVVREAAVRSLSMRPYPVQLMGALAMVHGNIAEMATGEGKTLTAALAASLWAWHGRPVHVITVNDYLVARDAQEMGPVYHLLGLKVGHVVHETTPQERPDHYRRNVVYVTSKELVADFLRDQLALNGLKTRMNSMALGGADGKIAQIDLVSSRTSAQTAVGMIMSGARNVPLMVPGLWRVIVDEADSLLIDEAVTPLIISNSPQEEANADLY